MVLLTIPARGVFTSLVGEGKNHLPLTPPMSSEEGNGGAFHGKVVYWLRTRSKDYLYRYHDRCQSGMCIIIP